MLRGFSFQNYRAFRSGTFKIRPITIILGANSVGKTSLIQLPLVLSQTANMEDRNYRSALRLLGRDVNFGAVHNIFFRHKHTEPLELRVEFESHNLLELLTELLPRTFATTIASLADLSANIIARSRIDDKVSIASNREVARREIAARATTKPYQFDRIRELVNDARNAYDRFSPEVKQLFVARPFVSRGRLNSSGPAGLRSFSMPDFERTSTLLDAVSSIKDPTFEIGFTMSRRLDGDQAFLSVDAIAVYAQDKRIVRIVIDDGIVTDVVSDFVSSTNVDKLNELLTRFIEPRRTIFNTVSRRPRDELTPDLSVDEIPTKGSASSASPKPTELCRTIVDILLEAVDELESVLMPDAVGHVAPLRGAPKRFYFVDAAQSGGTANDKFVEALRDDPFLKGAVNDWLGRFGIDIEVDKIEEMLYRVSAESDGHFRLDISDVGFGISQILPVLVEGFSSGPGRVVFVEQPEIHLHPRMQGDLADLFIDMSNISERRADELKYFIIETHSEYLLNRLRRRIAEGMISSDDVAIWFVEKDVAVEGSGIRQVVVPVDGSFEWPADFYEGGLDDTLAFLRGRVARGE